MADDDDIPQAPHILEVDEEDSDEVEAPHLCVPYVW